MTDPRPQVDFNLVNDAALAALPAILADLLPGGYVKSGEYVALNPTRADKHLGSFRIQIKGPRSGQWHDFASGEKGGDPVSLVAFVDGIGQVEAARRLASRLGVNPFKPNGAVNGAKLTLIRKMPYEYRDASGTVRYRKFRREYADGTKDFFFEPPSRKEGQQLLFGCERLADAAEGQAVWIVEGEGKVDAISRLGAIAVSGDTGATSKWLPSHAELLRGLPIILWPDSDEPGETYIANAAAAIRADTPGADLRVVRPFPIVEGEKGRDVCDWTGDAEACATLAASAVPYGATRTANGEAPESEKFFNESTGRAEQAPPGAKNITAKPYIYRDPKTIPPRQFLHAGHYIREFLSSTVAPGGIGKTSLQLVEAISMVTGRDLLRGLTSPHRLKVWYWNLEDPRDEIDRRIAAIVLHYKLDPAELEGRLFINSDDPLVIATKSRDLTVVGEPVVNELTAEMLRLGIDVLTVDPFVSCHKVPENDNGAIDTVAKAWSGIARTCNCAVELAHHIRKSSGGSTEVTVEDGRGAGSLKDAARSVRVLNTMTKEDADGVGIKPDQRRRYFRVDAGKSNMKPPAENTEWCKLVSVPLDNDTPEHEGDWVGVVSAWKMPGALEGVTVADLLRVQKRISKAKWRENSQARAWVGKAVAEVLSLDVREPAVKKRIAGMLKSWIGTGALKVVEGEDETRHKFNFVEVGEWAN